ncbi:MAG: acyltransferase [Ponticaulis sp.]|nr:acyltransferase [Ponticaulis sp.]
MKYRPEIDGLRTLAVVPVILFHAGFELFSGGYVGVDVFFVISGYLITTILITEHDEGRFSLINFYERRARRILPALLFVILCCLPFAWMWLLPDDLIDFGKSLLATALFSSNIYFWMDSDYFATASELKPLLHTWSLAVEEQFYIFFPLALMVFWRFGKRFLIGLFALAFIVSLGMSHWAAYNKPDANFFLLPTRAWELLIGSVCAFWLQKRALPAASTLSQLLGLSGICLIIYSIVFFDGSTPFPSLYALVPTVGTALIILFAGKNTLTGALLSLKPMVGIGLISYSAYLWHQPIFAFARLRSLLEPSHTLMLGLSVLSLVLAFFSWKFVEAPFRNRKRISRNSTLSLGASGVLASALAGVIFVQTNGFEDLKLATLNETQRYKYELLNESTGYDMYERMHSAECKFWARDIQHLNPHSLGNCLEKFGAPVLVLGDSHAMNIYNVVARSDEFEFVIGIAQGGCRPHTPISSCHYESFLEYFTADKSLRPFVIYHQSGSYFLKDDSGDYEPPLDKPVFFDPNNVVKVTEYLNEISSLGIKVVWLGPFVEYRSNLTHIYFQDIPKNNFSVFNNLEKDLTERIEEYSSFSYIEFDDFYRIPAEVVFEDCLIWRDGDHFSTCGENIISKNANWSVIHNLR